MTGYAKRKLIVLLLSVAVIMSAADLYIFKCLSEREAAVQQAVGNKTCDSDIRIQAVKQLADFEGLEIAGMEEYTVRIKYCGGVSDANAMFNMLGAEENVIRIGEIIISAVGDETEISADIEYLSNSICK